MRGVHFDRDASVCQETGGRAKSTPELKDKLIEGGVAVNIRRGKGRQGSASEWKNSSDSETNGLG